MYEVKGNGDGTYSIYKDGIIVVGAKIKSIKQNYITTERNGSSEYTLTDQEATISIPDGNGGFQSISNIPVK